MAPVPLEGHQTPVTNMPQEGNRGGSISLGLLIDFIIQRTYHELSVLAELLPRKTDMERKIEIYNFSARTRQLFVRLLALVKWASSATKVEKSAHIMNFLDKQSLLFVDTADILARMARETLVHARLPNFHIPAAVEVLTTGSYNRLPACIREKIVPADPITPAEKKSTLQRLNQVIQHRLVTGNLLPEMKNLKIDAGRVTFRVEQEFSVSLTVMGDGPNLPWKLLDLKVLVSDRETGDGKSLVHPLQTQYVHEVIQRRLAESSEPLAEVYHILHYFCQSLQLEVLYSQTLRLIRDRLDDHIRIDRYVCGECLTISYWKELTSKDSGSELGYKLSVIVGQHEPAKPLRIVHTPSLANKECELSDLAIRSNQLSLEYLLVHTIYIRTRNRLNDLKQEIQSMFKGIECTLAGSPAVLSVPVLQPCLRAESLLVAVDTHTGMLQCHIPQYEAPLVPELTAALNEDHARLPALIQQLRYWITKKRCEKTLQHLPASCHEKLPLLYGPEHPIAGIGKHRLFVQFHRHPSVILIVSFQQPTRCDIQCSFHLCAVKPSSTDASHESSHDDSIDQARSHNIYLRLDSLIEFDAFVVTHGSFTSIDCEAVAAAPPPPPSTEAPVGTSPGEATSEAGPSAGPSAGKRRRSAGASARPESAGATALAQKRAKAPAYFIPELAHVVALCDEQIPFVLLAQELSRRDIAHQGLQIEANATGLVLKLVQLPAPRGPRPVGAQAWSGLLKRLLSVAVRAQAKGASRFWLVEYVMYGSPLMSSQPKEQGLRRPVYFQYEMASLDGAAQVVDGLLSDWAQIVQLYGLAHDLAEHFRSEKSNLRNVASVKSYNYSKLVLAYGPQRRASVQVRWHNADGCFRLQFGRSPAAALENAHSLLREQLEVWLNRERDLAQVLHVLNESLAPLTSVARLPVIPQLGLLDAKRMPVQTFVLMPQCISLVRIAYQSTYCLELCFRGEGLVSLRDGAYSRFEHSNVVDGFTPIQCLGGFLSQYADKSALYRRRSQSEDDNPPSPVTIDGEAAAASSAAPGSMGFLGHRGPQSPAAQQQRFHPPATPPSGISNPNTPASPHTVNQQQQQQQQQQPSGQPPGQQQTGAQQPSGQQQQQPGQQQPGYGNSPGMSLSLASPPALTPSTPNVMPHPSPGGGGGGGGGLVASPLSAQMHAPSPAALMPTSSPGPCGSVGQLGHSPASSFMQAGGHGLDGSPFPSSQSMASPAASNWVNSPSISRPSPARPGQSPGGGHVPLHSPQQPMAELRMLQQVSRVLPQRSWAGAIPTLLSYETLDLLCSPSKHPGQLPAPDMSPLERFLGCVFMIRQLKRFIQSNENLSIIGSSEPGVMHFKLDSLQCRVALSPQHMQSLHIKIQPAPEAGNKQWTHDELQLLEKFFDSRVAAPPYKPTSLLSFVNLLGMPFNVLRDFVQIIKLELMPGLLQQQQQPQQPPAFKWSVQLCMRVPPSVSHVVGGFGSPAIIQHVQHGKVKVLFFLHMTRLTGVHCAALESEEAPSIVLPLVYDIRANSVSVTDGRDGLNPLMNAVNMFLKRFAEYAANAQECSVFPAVRNLMANMTLPSENIVQPGQPGMAPSMPAAPLPGPAQQIPSAGPMQMMPQGPQIPPQGPYRAQAMPPMNMMPGPQ